MAAHALVALLSTPLLINLPPVCVSNYSCFRFWVATLVSGARGVQADSGAISQLGEKFCDVFRYIGVHSLVGMLHMWFARGARANGPCYDSCPDRLSAYEVAHS